MDSSEIFLTGFAAGMFTGVVAAILFEFLGFLFTEFLKRRKRRVW